MHLRIVYQNEKYDYIKDTFLDDLLRSKQIKKFFRPSQGWVMVEQATLRGAGGTYTGPERRRKESIQGE